MGKMGKEINPLFYQVSMLFGFIFYSESFSMLGRKQWSRKRQDFKKCLGIPTVSYKDVIY